MHVPCQFRLEDISQVKGGISSYGCCQALYQQIFIFINVLSGKLDKAVLKIMGADSLLPCWCHEYMNELYAFLETFLLFGPVPDTAETGAYIPFLVVVSYIIAALACFVAIELSAKLVTTSSGNRRSLFHYAGAFALGAGIWSMHFIGMLAYDLDMYLEYDPWLTLFSLIIAMAAGYWVLWLVRQSRHRAIGVMFGAIVLGLGICGMHYTGMAAMEMDGRIVYKPLLFMASVAIAIAASAAALVIIFAFITQSGGIGFVYKAIAALVMGGGDLRHALYWYGGDRFYSLCGLPL